MLKYAVTSLLALASSCGLTAQVTVPFDVPSLFWKGLVTPVMEGQLFQTSDLFSDILIRIEGPEWDDYEWRKQSPNKLQDGETSWVLAPGDIFPVKSGAEDFMVEIEFAPSFVGYTQNYGLREVEFAPLDTADLEELDYVAYFPGSDGNTYAVLNQGTEMNFGWAGTFNVGKLSNGVVIFPYECTVECSLDSNHSGILNGKLGNADFSKFTWPDIEYILNHATPVEDGVYVVLYGYKDKGTKRLNQAWTKMVGKAISDAGTGSAAANINPEIDNQIYTEVEQGATYTGGASELLSTIARNIRYPAIAAENGIQGKVIVRFIVEKDGSISNAEIVKSVEPDLDREALRVIGSLGRMSSPGKMNGRPVRSYYTLPVNFKL